MKDDVSDGRNDRRPNRTVSNGGGTVHFGFRPSSAPSAHYVPSGHQGWLKPSWTIPFVRWRLRAAKVNGMGTKWAGKEKMNVPPVQVKDWREQPADITFIIFFLLVHLIIFFFFILFIFPQLISIFMRFLLAKTRYRFSWELYYYLLFIFSWFIFFNPNIVSIMLY